MSLGLYEFGPYRLDAAGRKLWRGEEHIRLTGKQFDVLYAVVRRGPGIAETGEILEEVWPGDRSDLESRVSKLARHVSDLRKRLSPTQDDPNYIENVSGQGYFISVPVGTILTGDEVPSIPATERYRKLPAWLLWIAIPALIVFLGGAGYVWERAEGLRVTEYRRLTNDGRVKAGPLLTDGRRVFFLEQIDKQWKAMSVPVSGGDVSALGIPLPVVRLCGVAPDRSALLLSIFSGSGMRLVSWSLSGGTFQMLPQDSDDAAWAPDGKTIAVADGTSLRVAKAGGERFESSVSRFARVGSPHWSPDGARISFTLEEPNNQATSLWQADREGRHWERMPQTERSGVNQSHGIWMADARHFVYEAGSIDRHDLWAIPASRSLGWYFGKPMRLTNGLLNWTWPAPLIGASRLIALGDSTRGELVRLDPRTGAWTPYLGGAPAYEIDFSRDRKWLTYTRYPDHTIWKTKADGSEPDQLTSPEFQAHQPHWSPDGSRIAFMGQRPDGRWRVFVLDVATKAIHQPIPDGDDQGVPTWSNDGHSLVFGERLFVKDQKAMTIRVFDERSGQLSVVPRSANLWTPRWSPDGIYVSALRPDGTALLLSRCCYGEWKTILDGVNNLDDSMWSYDSKYIFLMVNSGLGRRQLIRVEIPDGRVERIADITGFRDAGEQWFGLAPDNSVLGMRGVLIQEIYALEYARP